MTQLPIKVRSCASCCLSMVISTRLRVTWRGGISSCSKRRRPGVMSLGSGSWRSGSSQSTLKALERFLAKPWKDSAGPACSNQGRWQITLSRNGPGHVAWFARTLCMEMRKLTYPWRCNGRSFPRQGAVWALNPSSAWMHFGLTCNAPWCSRSCKFAG